MKNCCVYRNSIIVGSEMSMVVVSMIDICVLL